MNSNNVIIIEQDNGLLGVFVHLLPWLFLVVVVVFLCWVAMFLKKSLIKRVGGKEP